MCYVQDSAGKENELDIRDESASLMVDFSAVEWSGHLN